MGRILQGFAQFLRLHRQLCPEVWWLTTDVQARDLSKSHTADVARWYKTYPQRVNMHMVDLLMHGKGF